MKLAHLRMSNMLRFRDEVAIDFTEIADGLIAITGGNGEGKTALLEAPIAALYRKFPSRKSALPDYAAGAALIEATFALPSERDDDETRLISGRVLVSKKTRTQEAVILEGGDSLTDGKVTTYDAWVSKHLPPLEILLASAFAAQNKAGSFTVLDRAGRKQLFATLLGLDRYEVMAKVARASIGRCQDQLRGNQATKAALQHLVGGATLEGLHEAVAFKEEELCDAKAAVTSAKADLDKADRAVATAALTAKDIATATLQVERLTREITDCETKRDDIKQGTSEWETMRAERHRAERVSYQQRIKHWRDRVQSAQALLDNAESVKAAATDARSYTQQVQELTAQREQALSVDRQLASEVAAMDKSATAQADRDERLRELRLRVRAVSSVPCGAKDEFRSCHFLSSSDDERREVAELEGRLESERDYRSELMRVMERHLDHNKDMTRIAKEQAALLAEDEGERSRALIAEQDLLTAEHCVAEAKREELEETARYTASIEQVEREADARKAVDDAAYKEVEASQALKRSELDLAMARLGSQEFKDLERRLAQARHAKAEAESLHLSEVARVARHEQELVSLCREIETHAKHVDDIRQLDATIEAQALEVEDWSVLEKGLGRNGLPLYEIDMAGPAVSDICNELLQASFGGRFSIELVTQVPKKGKGKDGSAVKDTFAIEVTDRERPGEVRDLGDLSGGEQIMVDESLKAALAVYCNKRGPMQMRTCWRDETTGPLDAEHTDRYIRMLRAMLSLGGFAHIIYITHSPEAAAQADTHIVVEDGKAEVQ